jgi:hypothetical protein
MERPEVAGRAESGLSEPSSLLTPGDGGCCDAEENLRKPGTREVILEMEKVLGGAE